jgi:hypothetical protein
LLGGAVGGLPILGWWLSCRFPVHSGCRIDCREREIWMWFGRTCNAVPGTGLLLIIYVRTKYNVDYCILLHAYGKSGAEKQYLNVYLRTCTYKVPRRLLVHVSVIWIFFCISFPVPKIVSSTLSFVWILYCCLRQNYATWHPTPFCHNFLYLEEPESSMSFFYYLS